MKCSRCYTQIPPNEEITKTSIFPFYQTEKLCQKCAQERDKQKRWYWIILGIIVLITLITILGIFWKVGKIFDKIWKKFPSN